MLGIALVLLWVLTWTSPVHAECVVDTDSPTFVDGKRIDLRCNASGELITSGGGGGGGASLADTELPAAAALADDTVNPTVPGVASFNMCYDGTTWDRCQKADAGAGNVSSTTQRVVLADNSIPCTSFIAVSQADDATVITGTASQYIYICSIVLVGAASEVINIIEGTGTVCATGTTVMAGSSTQANGMSFAANGGFSAVSAFPFMRTSTLADNLCITQSGTSRVSGWISYRKAP